MFNDEVRPVAHPGLPPNTTGLTDQAKQRVMAAYAEKLDAHVGWLMTLDASRLSVAEAQLLAAEVLRSGREEGWLR
jgi:hypothetical protein